jgi:hypothetical protein
VEVLLLMLDTAALRINANAAGDVTLNAVASDGTLDETICRTLWRVIDELNARRLRDQEAI